jgi:hypothetical protein
MTLLFTAKAGAMQEAANGLGCWSRLGGLRVTPRRTPTRGDTGEGSANHSSYIPDVRDESALSLTNCWYLCIRHWFLLLHAFLPDIGSFCCMPLYQTLVRLAACLCTRHCSSCLSLCTRHWFVLLYGFAPDIGSPCYVPFVPDISWSFCVCVFSRHLFLWLYAGCHKSYVIGGYK